MIVNYCSLAGQLLSRSVDTPQANIPVSCSMLAITTSLPAIGRPGTDKTLCLASRNWPQKGLKQATLCLNESRICVSDLEGWCVLSRIQIKDHSAQVRWYLLMGVWEEILLSNCQEYLAPWGIQLVHIVTGILLVWDPMLLPIYRFLYLDTAPNEDLYCKT